MTQSATSEARSKSQAIGAAQRELNPNTSVMVARGSSDYAESYLCYATPLVLGCPVASIGPSIQSVCGKELKMGAALRHAAEQHLKEIGQRILIVDTSGTDDFALTRKCCAQNGYEEEARIRDFWAEGDDKVIFRKAL